ncbi:hypothetical protein JW848_10965, partial [Candidatus Bipolaricaulota bacterium]|nr:hypothetical protein [Candidatus Bipolaricaulota bacterium]
MNQYESVPSGPIRQQPAPEMRLVRAIREKLPPMAELLEAWGSPVHVLFTDEVARIAATYKSVLESEYDHGWIAFASKSNPCAGAIQTAAALGLGVDAVSEFELQAALEAGVDGAHIVCNGNAKSDRYISMAVERGLLIAVDGGDELAAVETIAEQMGHEARILLRVSGLPVAGYTAADQTTASVWTKFGFSPTDISAALGYVGRSSNLVFQGFSAHIGTQLSLADPYDLLFRRYRELCLEAREIGLETRILDLGGGFPVSFVSEAWWEAFRHRLWRQLRGESGDEAVTWDALPMGYAHLSSAQFRDDASDDHHWVGKAYWSAHPAAEMLRHALQRVDPETEHPWKDVLRSLGEPALIIEPGRSLMATAGITVARAMTAKRVAGHLVVSLDMGINNHGTNLITPDIFPVSAWPPADDDQPVEAFLAGRLCFSGDMISKVKLPLNRLPKRNEPVVIFLTGAYGADHFASHSCGFPLPAKLAVTGGGAIEV